MKRKINSVIIALIFVFSFCCRAVMAEYDFSVKVGNASANSGDAVRIPVDITENSGFTNLALEIGYNSDVMTLKSAETSISGVSFTTAQKLERNPYNIQWDSTKDITYSGTLCVLTFEIKTSANDGTYPVTVDFYKGRNGSYVDGINVNYKANPNDNTKYIPLKINYISGSVTVGKAVPEMKISEKDISNLQFSLDLLSGSYEGSIYAALYDDDGRLISAKQYPADENVFVSFDKGKTGAYAKIMWWDDNMSPKCEAQIIPIH